jgi:superfamily II RNA helicase
MTTTSSFLMTPDAMVAPTVWPPAEGLFLDNGYEPDPFQKHAILGIHTGDHVFVTAKTGSGKTFVGEYLIARALAMGGRVFYTTPIKSLSNQKYHDLKKLFPTATVGILTGDIKMQPDAQIVVMTAEILRNLFYKRGTATEGVGTTAAVSLEGVVGVVMDEVHYIQDPDRGHVWEETLILCPRDLQLVLLSATLPSAASLAGWLADLHQRRTWLLSTTYRIVPLVHGMLVADEAAETKWRVMPLLDGAGRWLGDAYTGWLRDRKAIEDAAAAHKKAVDARRRDGYAAPPPKTKIRVEDPIARLKRLVRWLDAAGQMPALFFVFSRKECERLATVVEGSLLDSSDAAAAEHIFDFHLSRHKAVLEKSPQYHKIRELLLRGIAFHHSGLQPVLKEAVEILFTRGYVRALFATETFSVGLNMPTKTVVFLELEKWCDGGQRRLLRPDEYIQMAGRAGRRGIDTSGLVLYEPLREPIASLDLKGLLTGALPALQSRMRFHYDFIMKHRLGGASAPPIAEQSYWAVQQRATRVSMNVELVTMNEQLAAMEIMVPLTIRETLAERDLLESTIATSSNSARKKAQLALSRWLDEHKGAVWDNHTKTYKAWKELRLRRDLMVADCAAWDSAPLLNLDPQEECLSRWGFLKDGAVTPLGFTATEVNEGHCLLMPVLAESGKCDDLTGEEIACVLAGFLREGVKEECAPSIDDFDLREEVIAVLDWIDETGRDMQKDEDRLRIFSPLEFWALSPTWVGIVSHWIAGAGLSEIAATFDMFEGNVQRGLMRVANLLEEWGAVATLRNDLAMLEKLRSLRFLRNEIIVDSLYLRM